MGLEEYTGTTMNRLIGYVSAEELGAARTAIHSSSSWVRFMAGTHLYHVATGQLSWQKGQLSEGAALLYYCVRHHNPGDMHKCCQLVRSER